MIKVQHQNLAVPSSWNHIRNCTKPRAQLLVMAGGKPGGHTHHYPQKKKGNYRSAKRPIKINGTVANMNTTVQSQDATSLLNRGKPASYTVSLTGSCD